MVEEEEEEKVGDDGCYSDSGESGVMKRVDSIAEVLQQTSRNLALFERLLPAATAREKENSLQGCECEKLKEKLAKMELRYSELQMNYLAKEQELRTLTVKLNQMTVNNSGLPEPPRQEADRVSSPSPADLHLTIQPEGSVPTKLDSQQDLKSTLKKLGDTEESRLRLKEKTKLLLRKYRDKRALLERRERQLIGQRVGLQQLQLLLSNQNSCQMLVLRHTASHLEELARLLAALLPHRGLPPSVVECTRENLVSWCSQLSTLAHWTKQIVLSAFSGVVVEDGETRRLPQPSTPGPEYSLLVTTLHNQQQVVHALLSQIDAK